MRLGVIGDDFTGSSDVGLILAEGGMRTVQYVGVPDRAADAGVEAGVVSLKTRSVPPADAVARSLEALEWLREQGCAQYLFKYCSTFDSTPEGNIGPVLDALIDALGIGASSPDGAAPVIVCPAFPATGRTLYQGHLFVGDALLSESGLQDHPLNPMTDPDLRRWLARQSARAVGHVPLASIRAGRAAETLRAEAAAGRPLIVCDAIEDSDLLALGAAARGLVLLSGGSGIALGLPALHGVGAGTADPLADGASIGRDRLARVGADAASGGIGWTAIEGPALMLSGSCSQATRAQIRRHAADGGAQRRIEIAALVDARESAAQALGWAEAHADERPLVYSSDDPQRVAEAQARFGAERSAELIESFFGELAALAVRAGVRRLVTAGGETSGAVVTALGLDALAIGPMIDPGVPVLSAAAGEHGEPLALALKSGNFGAEDFFDKALAIMAGEANGDPGSDGTGIDRGQADTRAREGRDDG